MSINGNKKIVYISHFPVGIDAKYTVIGVMQNNISTALDDLANR